MTQWNCSVLFHNPWQASLIQQ